MPLLDPQRLARAAFRRLLGRRLPLTDGTMTVGGILHPVTIRRDRWSIPHIDAESDADGWYGLGFAMGQDRSFQIEVFARLAGGRLAELIGADGVPMDRFMRRLGIGRIAPEQLASMTPERRQTLVAFAEGITAGRTVGSPRRPHEHVLLRATPEPISASDVVGILSLSAFLLSANWQTELARLLVLTLDGADALRDLDAVAGQEVAVSTPPGGTARAATHLAEDLGLLAWYMPTGGASNNWALAGSRTATGRPLVANDPHMPAMLPSPWYLAHIRTPRWAVAGAALAGTPAVAAGHNGFAAWGNTSGHADDSDLFLERVSADLTLVRDADGWIPTTTRSEVIEVKGGTRVVETVVETPRGPVVSDVLDTEGLAEIDAGEGAVTALSIASTGLRFRGDVEGYLAAPGTRSFDEFRQSFQRWPGMSLNVVYADESGTVGWQLVGALPVRRSGRGFLPAPGWDPATGWEPMDLAFDRMPSLRDPDSGWVATANNQPTQLQEDAWLGVDFLEDYRVRAIGRALGARHDWDVEATFALQRDVTSLPWEEARTVVLAADRSDPDAHAGLALLEQWDGQVAADSLGATVFELSLAGLAERLVEARAPRAGHWLLGHSAAPSLLERTLPGLVRTSHTIRLLQEQPPGWFDDPWPVVIGEVVAAAIRRLRANHGSDRSSWTWGAVRPVVLQHPVSRSSAILGAVFDRGPVPIGGDSHTIPQASVHPGDPEGPPLGFPNLRMAVPVGDWSQARWALAGGQSGNPMSAHYDDQLESWLTGTGVPIAWTQDEVNRACESAVRLLPRA